jgi:RimJ/RimL family protein N-acetyltransferase
MEHFPAPLTPAESDALLTRVENHFADRGFGPFAVELLQDGTLAGFIGLSIPNFDAPFMPAVEIGWRLGFEHWGKGLATEGARAALDYGFNSLGLKQIVSFTVPANLRSRRVMEKLGMTHDPAGDFDHPNLAEGHPLRRHVLYRIRRGIPG